MALSRRERRPSFRLAELLGGTSTGRRMDRKTEDNAGRLSAGALQGEETRQETALRAPVCGNRPPLPCPMETWRRCGTAHCWSGRREGGARSSVALRSAAVRESLRSGAPEPELELKRRLRARSREVSSGERGPGGKGSRKGGRITPSRGPAGRGRGVLSGGPALSGVRPDLARPVAAKGPPWLQGAARPPSVSGVAAAARNSAGAGRGAPAFSWNSGRERRGRRRGRGRGGGPGQGPAEGSSASGPGLLAGRCAERGGVVCGLTARQGWPLMRWLGCSVSWRVATSFQILAGRPVGVLTSRGLPASELAFSRTGQFC